MQIYVYIFYDVSLFVIIVILLNHSLHTSITGWTKLNLKYILFLMLNTIFIHILCMNFLQIQKNLILKGFFLFKKYFSNYKNVKCFSVIFLIQIFSLILRGPVKIDHFIQLCSVHFSYSYFKMALTFLLYGRMRTFRVYTNSK